MKPLPQPKKWPVRRYSQPLHLHLAKMKLIGCPVIQARIVVLLQLLIYLRHCPIVAATIPLQPQRAMLFEGNRLFVDRYATVVFSLCPSDGRGEPYLAHVTEI